ncbi:MAG TPA: LysR substrate-binding domain-containing protein [Usitatibacter sp.]|nr:LysR substrate-binding domain-containing protein [Usitatibacter sp.]
MDKLRSLQYFIAAAEGGSFSQAARRLEVTIPAVAKLVNALERSLGVPLFERSAKGLALTAQGTAYLEQCRPALDLLEQADDQARTSLVRPRGHLVVGAQHFIADSILAAALPGFHARYPDIQLDLRNNTQVTGEEDLRSIDVFLSVTWPDMPEMIHRRVGSSRFMVCAAPEYWAEHGMPEHPADLERHDCFTIRTQRGALMDLWNFSRASEKVSVVAKGWLMVSNTHRDSAIQLALAGHGVVRLLDFSSEAALADGRLVPALTDWEAMDAPPVYLSYWPSGRRTARVRVFLDFVVQLFREIEERRAVAPRLYAAPRWTASKHGRASAIAGRARALQSGRGR